MYLLGKKWAVTATIIILSLLQRDLVMAQNNTGVTSQTTSKSTTLATTTTTNVITTTSTTPNPPTTSTTTTTSQQQSITTAITTTTQQPTTPDPTTTSPSSSSISSTKSTTASSTLTTIQSVSTIASLITTTGSSGDSIVVTSMLTSIFSTAVPTSVPDQNTNSGGDGKGINPTYYYAIATVGVCFLGLAVAIYTFRKWLLPTSKDSNQSHSHSNHIDGGSSVGGGVGGEPSEGKTGGSSSAGIPSLDRLDRGNTIAQPLGGENSTWAIANSGSATSQIGSGQHHPNSFYIRDFGSETTATGYNVYDPYNNTNMYAGTGGGQYRPGGGQYEQGQYPGWANTYGVQQQMLTTQTYGQDQYQGYVVPGQQQQPYYGQDQQQQPQQQPYYGQDQQQPQQPYYGQDQQQQQWQGYNVPPGQRQ
ncbi:hypothetical protein HDU76_013971 [Blyttiomyces sp. JEL0837]|nr:hypothetical protein HDU76_013971 [Blyttiomyces sp. JEL0837]